MLPPGSTIASPTNLAVLPKSMALVRLNAVDQSEISSVTVNGVSAAPGSGT